MNLRMNLLAAGLLAVTASGSLAAADVPTVPGAAVPAIPRAVVPARSSAPVISHELAPVSVCPLCRGPAGQGTIWPSGGLLCRTCGRHGSPTTGHTPCDRPLFGPHGHLTHRWAERRKPFPVELCPGACFGYFQTQWRRWEEVCPYTYQGVGLSDAPRPPVPLLPSPSGPVPPRKTGGDTLPPPRSSDALPMPPSGRPSSDLPPIPLPDGL